MAAKHHRDKKEEQASEQASAPAGAAPTAGAAAAGSSKDATTQLRELGELHEQGVLTDDEFEREKAKVLGS